MHLPHAYERIELDTQGAAQQFPPSSSSLRASCLRGQPRVFVVFVASCLRVFVVFVVVVSSCLRAFVVSLSAFVVVVS